MTDRSKGVRPTRAFILVYAVGVMVLVSLMAATLAENSQPDLAASKARMYAVMARVAADSGIDYGMAVINRELARTPDAYTSPITTGGPWNGPLYTTPRDPAPDCDRLKQHWNWMRAHTLRSSASAECCEYSAVEHMTLRVDGSDGEDGGNKLNVLIVRAQLALAPELTYVNVHDATVNTTASNPTVFRLRSRGEVIFDNDNNDDDVGDILATAYVVQSFMVPQGDSVCVYPGGGAQAIRLLWESDPSPDLIRNICPPNPH